MEGEVGRVGWLGGSLLEGEGEECFFWIYELVIIRSLKLRTGLAFYSMKELFRIRIWILRP